MRGFNKYTAHLHYRKEGSIRLRLDFNKLKKLTTLLNKC